MEEIDCITTAHTVWSKSEILLLTLHAVQYTEGQDVTASVLSIAKASGQLRKIWAYYDKFRLIKIGAQGNFVRYFKGCRDFKRMTVDEQNLLLDARVVFAPFNAALCKAAAIQKKRIAALSKEVEKKTSEDVLRDAYTARRPIPNVIHTGTRGPRTRIKFTPDQMEMFDHLGMSPAEYADGVASGKYKPKNMEVQQEPEPPPHANVPLNHIPAKQARQWVVDKKAGRLTAEQVLDLMEKHVIEVDSAAIGGRV